jgi:MFS family permease
MAAMEKESGGTASNAQEIETFERMSAAEAVNEKAAAQVMDTPVPPPVQDGGTRAWLQVLGSFLVFGNLWGFIFSFGSFQSYYEITYLPDVAPSSISWIGTMGVFLLVLVGVISGPLFDLGYFRTMLFVGAAFETFGAFMMSLCTEYWQLFITQGIILGLGNGMLYLPGLALVGRSFKKNRAIAMGITTCGAPVGGVIYTLVFEQLIEQLGYGWTVRVMSFIMLGSYLISFPLLLWGAKNVGDIGSGTARKLFDRTAFRDLPFWAYSFSNFLLFSGYMVPFFFMASFGQLELGMSRSMSLYVIMIAQASSIGGRLLASWTASRLGVMIPWVTCGMSSGIFCIAWIGVHTEGAFIAFAVLYGFFSGALIPLPPAIFPIVCPDPRVLGARLGMAQAMGSIASLIGPPIAAALAQVGTQGDERNYLGLQLFSGLIMFTGGVQLIILWVLLIKKREVGKLI